MPPASVLNYIKNMKNDFRDKDRFSGNYYDIWEMCRPARDIGGTGPVGVVDGSLPAPADTHVDYSPWIKSDQKARNIILASLDKSMMYHTSATPTSQAIWSRLKELYKSSNKMARTKQFHLLTMREGKSVEKYIQHFRSIRARMVSCGTNLSEIKTI